MLSSPPASLWALSTLLVTASIAAQDEGVRSQAPLPSVPASTSAVELGESTVPPLEVPRHDVFQGLRTAIHTAPDDPEGGAYGIWAAGETYKSSFHDDFTFVPYLGGGYPENQPFSWRTVSATVGGTSIATLAEPTRHQDDYRYEYRFKGLTEAYDVLVEGVEQTFVVSSRPALAGDLVVSGALTTSLVAAPVFDRHGDLLFVDAQGNKILRYGAAIAFDARGERTPVYTSYDGGQIHLRVPGQWLSKATYPVTIDPLLTRECVSFWNSADPAPAIGSPLEVEIGRDDIADQVMVAYTRQASASDSDLWAFLFTSDDMTYATRNQVFVDINASWGDASPAIAFAGGAADSWILAFIRVGVGAGGTQNGARYHVHASGDLVASGSVSSISRPTGSSHGAVIDAGGVMSFSSGDTVFVCYERTDTGSNSDVFGKPIDLSTNTQGTEILIDTSAVGTDRTRLRPNINQVAQSGSDGWVVAWQEYWNARNLGENDDWDINMRRIDGSGAAVGGVRVPSNSTLDDLHKLSPQVTGANNRYCLTMAVWAQAPQTPTTTDVGTDIFNETFSWTVADTFAFGSIAELTLGLVSDRRWRVTGNTHDTNTDSHWAIAFESTTSGSQYACTAGFDAGRIERVVAYSPTGAPKAFSGAVCFNDDANHFQFAYATNEAGAACGASPATNHTVYTQRMTHLPEPAELLLGTGCGPGNIGWSGRNLAGIRGYSITMNSATASVPAVLLLSLGSAAPTPLDIFGMTGCFANIDLALLVAQLPAATTASGTARITFPLPTNPAIVCGSLYWQWAYPAPINSLGIATTQGLETTFTCP